MFNKSEWLEGYKPRANELKRQAYAKNPERVNELNRKWRSGNKEKVRTTKKIWAGRHPDYYREYNLIRHYGLTLAQYNAMFETQKGLCAICGQPETKVYKRTGEVQRLAVDHDKTTKKVGGLVCDKHNKAMGLFDHDLALLEATIAYLKERNLGS